MAHADHGGNGRWDRLLVLLLDRGEARRALASAGAPRGWHVEEVLAAELVKERRDRRRTLRYRVVAHREGGPSSTLTWYAKQYRGSKGERVARMLQLLRERAPDGLGIGAPELIGYSLKLKLVVMGGLEGQDLLQALRGKEPDEAACKLDRVGRAVAALHAIPLSGIDLTHHGWEEEAEVLERAQARTQGSLPSTEVVSRWLTASTAVTHELAQWPPTSSAARHLVSGATTSCAPVLLHRDLHPGQIVLGDSCVALLDWDEAAYGEPELDVGNLQAHLILAGLQWGTSEFGWGCSHLRDGYLSRSPFDLSHRRLAVYTASALLRLVTLKRLADPAISVLPWPALSERLLEAALHQMEIGTRVR